MILGAILLAFVLSLSSIQPGEDYWVKLSMISLFIVWIAFGNILVLCVSRRFLHHLTPIASALSCYGLSLLVTLVVSILAVVTTPQETNLLMQGDSLLLNGFFCLVILPSALSSVRWPCVISMCSISRNQISKPKPAQEFTLCRQGFAPIFYLIV